MHGYCPLWKLFPASGLRAPDCPVPIQSVTSQVVLRCSFTRCSVGVWHHRASLSGAQCWIAVGPSSALGKDAPARPVLCAASSTVHNSWLHKYFFIHLMYSIAVQLCNKCRSIALQASEQLTNSAPADLPAPPPTTHSTQASQSTTRLVTTTTKASLRLLSNHFKIKKPLAWQYKTFPGHSLILEVSSIFFVSSSCTLAPILDFDPTQPLLSASWPKSHPSKIFVQSLVTKCHLCQPAESSVFCFEELLNCSSTDHKSNRTGSVVA